ncbi:ribosomal protein L4 [Rozella allomycis CSF55]|uniref:Large ribosomal subunit protein uL4m n=1 Tax=Rozella allomycis (strain CSF55) TaxID=988480 RepID=A0A075AUR1_ROZAC|nr:Ribosomal protein L4/L1e domain-containing protein [Rozella allomycis CSF55]RKP20845.1 ribosomal protein L4 [Rozella allomycis CSF55]|eukprot:EPZ33900.1 Ribosomal protein L4/L1e domain-containing protein [Rozella allomycis CSF55]
MSEPIKLIELEHRIFNAPIRNDVMHTCVIWRRACLRQGNKCMKSKAEKRGSGRKIRPQKGTGKARVGQIRAPHRRGGGKSHPPKPRDWSYPLNSKIQAFGLRSALTAKRKQNELFIIQNEDLKLNTPTLKELENIKLRNNWKSVLFIDTEAPERNLSQTLMRAGKKPTVNFYKADQFLTVYDVLAHKAVVMTERAALYYNEILKRGL